MTLKDYQEKCRETAVYPGIGENLFYPVLGLAGEVGEVCENVKKAVRDDGGVITDERRLKLKKELGDVLWYVATVCSELEFDLNEVAHMNVDKLQKRKALGVLGGSGSDREEQIEV